MRSQIRNRLFTQAQVEVAQSRIYQPDQSIIHQLQDLIDHDYQSNEHKYLTDRKPSKTIGLYSTPSHSTLLNLRTKNEGLKQFHIDKTLHSYQSRKRYQVIRNSEQLTTRPYLPNNMDLMDKERKKPQKQGQVLEQKKQGEMTNLKIKFNNSRSTLIKNKQVLKKSILPKCNKCGQILSEVYRNNVVCRNRKCRILTLYEDIETYPIFGIFYDIENPSCSCEELEDVVRRIKQEVLRIQKYRDQLIQLQYQMHNIIESKRKFQPNNKNELRHILTSVTEIKSKKIKDNDVDIQKIRNKIQKLQLRQCYEQFHRWSKIDIQKYRNSKSISDLIQQYKPLCLKSINTEIVQHIAQVTDDFNSGVALINASDFFSFNFSGNIHKMVVNIDGSIQLRRDNFLLIQTIHEFQIVFKSRKTSRQLRELFNILPNINKLVFDFDYKTHSHLSCQAFPLLTKAFQIAQQQVKINIYNARMEVFEDLLEVSKKPNPKRSIELKIQMNPYIQQQTPEHMKSKEWGTKLINNFIKNMGNKISKINLQLPFEANNKQISEFLLNIDYNLLIDLKMKMKQSNVIFDPKSNLEQLLQKIVLKKKLLMGKLLVQKRQKSHPLNKSRLLLESVYRVLF